MTVYRKFNQIGTNLLHVFIFQTCIFNLYKIYTFEQQSWKLNFGNTVTIKMHSPSVISLAQKHALPFQKIFSQWFTKQIVLLVVSVFHNYEIHVNIHRERGTIMLQIIFWSEFHSIKALYVKILSLTTNVASIELALQRTFSSFW